MEVTETCPGCGHPGSRKACQDVFDDVALRVRALAWTGSLTTWRLMHDVYAIQHPEDECTTWPDLIIHLGGVCWAIEHDGSEKGYRALQKFADRDHLKGEPYPPAQGLPTDRGAFAAASLKDFNQPVLLINGVDRWARSVWLAYEELQPMAREWVRVATA